MCRLRPFLLLVRGASSLPNIVAHLFGGEGEWNNMGTFDIITRLPASEDVAKLGCLVDSSSLSAKVLVDNLREPLPLQLQNRPS